MNVDLEDIRAMAARHPNMRVNTLLHQLEKRRKVEELREQRASRDAMIKEMDAKSGLFSWFDTWMGRG
jgi:predicted LPLAT superfamily acyltransferase